MRKHRVDKPHNLYLSRSVTQKLVLSSFDNINFEIFFFTHSDKLSISNYLSLDILLGAYSLGDSIIFTGVINIEMISRYFRHIKASLIHYCRSQ